MKLECTKAGIQDIGAHPEAWKFVDQGALANAITSFCKDEFKGTNNANSPNSKDGFFTSHEKGNLNEMILRINWDGQATISVDDCANNLKAISDNCDWSGAPLDDNPNQYK